MAAICCWTPTARKKKKKHNNMAAAGATRPGAELVLLRIKFVLELFGSRRFGFVEFVRG